MMIKYPTKEKEEWLSLSWMKWNERRDLNLVSSFEDCFVTEIWFSNILCTVKKTWPKKEENGMRAGGHYYSQVNTTKRVSGVIKSRLHSLVRMSLTWKTASLSQEKSIHQRRDLYNKMKNKTKNEALCPSNRHLLEEEEIPWFGIRTFITSSTSRPEIMMMMMTNKRLSSESDEIMASLASSWRRKKREEGGMMPTLIPFLGSSDSMKSWRSCQMFCVKSVLSEDRETVSSFFSWFPFYSPSSLCYSHHPYHFTGMKTKGGESDPSRNQGMKRQKWNEFKTMRGEDEWNQEREEWRVHQERMKRGEQKIREEHVVLTDWWWGRVGGVENGRGEKEKERVWWWFRLEGWIRCHQQFI